MFTKTILFFVLGYFVRLFNHFPNVVIASGIASE